MVAIITLLLVLYLSLFINRIATIALTHTGMTKQAARLQARSALSGCGFTTSESEEMVNHPVRRKILMLLILVGNIGFVTVMSSLVLGFVHTDPHDVLAKLPILVVGLAVLWFLTMNRWVDRTMSKLVEWALKRYTDLDIKDYAHLFHLADDFRLAELRVQKGDWIADQLLGDLHLREEGVVVLGIQRGKGAYIGAPRGETRLLVGDNLIMYGRKEAIADLGERRATDGGAKHQEAIEREHDRAVSEKKRNQNDPAFQAGQRKDANIKNDGERT